MNNKNNENMEKLKCKVSMLPTKEELAPIGSNISGNLFLLTINLFPQHLCLISDREIKEGDWVYMEDFKVQKCIDPFAITCAWKKIETTTDPSLNSPLIPQSFIEEFVKKQGNIKEVMIEMEDAYTSCKIPSEQYHILAPKLNPDGTVIIHPIKESWTREEHIVDIKRIIQLYETTYSGGNIDEWIEKNL